MANLTNLCPGCMNEKLYTGPCEICGYDGRSELNDGRLKVGTMLVNRYLIGRLISRNGEGCIYMALDTVENKKAEIKEFMPDSLCSRAKDGISVEVKENCLPLYKSYLSDYSDLHKTLMSYTDSGCLQKIYGIFASGNTGYVIMEYRDGTPLSQYLRENGGKLKWGSTKELISGLFDTLISMHSKGIIHRGLSPETLYVKKDGSLMLTSVGISAVRSADSNIDSEMYSGYAACEQYSLSERQGGWTDVYGLCAVIYRMITGVEPPDAAGRETDDRFIAPAEIDDEIPKYVSDAITAGMRPNWNERTHTVALLREALFSPPPEMPKPVYEEPEDDGPITPIVAPSLSPEPTKAEIARMTVREKKKKEKRRANAGTAVGLTLFLVLAAGLVVAILYFSNESQRITDETVTAQTTATEETTRATTAATTAPPETTSTTADNRERLMMPSFKNRFFNSQLESRYSMLNFEPEYEYTNDWSKGLIFDQDIAEGTQVTDGTTVKIKVSAGPESVPMPDFYNYKLSNYVLKLTDLGIKYVTKEQESSEVKAGYVIWCSKAPGELVNVTEEEAETVTVYYAIAAVETEPPQTEATLPESEEYEEEYDEEG